MNSRQRKTLARIFAEPTPADLRWAEIEALFRALGADIGEGAGSRVRVALRGVRAVFHRPHPSPTAKRSTVRAVRDFLGGAGVGPENGSGKEQAHA
jgi:HicA toxin of bacterial toxin-antitoxin,